MKNFVNTLTEAKHIAIIVNKNPDIDSLASASALYSSVLQLHKKVSFVCKEENRYSSLLCISWIDKMRKAFHSSVDLLIIIHKKPNEVVECDSTCKTIKTIDIFQSNYSSISEYVYNLFYINNVKINVKMATDLYAGIVSKTERFLDKNPSLGVATNLKELGADIALCNRVLYQEKSLASLRLKALMLASFTLLYDARIAYVHVDIQMLQKSGATLYDSQEIVDEILALKCVEVAILVQDIDEEQCCILIYSKDNIEVTQNIEIPLRELSYMKKQSIELIIKELNA